MSYLDERGKSILTKIADKPIITGKELEKSLGLSRKQLSYALDKVNDYLLENGFEKIDRLKTGKFSTPLSVIEEFRNTVFEVSEGHYMYSEKERLDLIVLLLLCSQEELSMQHFTGELDISKNTFLSDLKKIQTLVNEKYRLSILYSRKEGYTLIGSEYEKRELLIFSIKRILHFPNGIEFVKRVCSLLDEDIEKMNTYIVDIEKTLEIQFTDERLFELPYILIVIIQRVFRNKFLDTVPEAYQHIVGTKEYNAISKLTKEFHIDNQLEKMFISAQIQISNMHYLKSDEYRMEKKLMKAADEMIQNFESICCIKFEERNALLEALVQHCKPAFYRIKYQYHIENSIIDMVLPQHAYLHEMVKKSIKPFVDMLQQDIKDEELVYITVLFGGWLRREGLLDIVEERKRAIVVCTNGVSVSNFLYITLKELFPEFEFIACLSSRAFGEYEKNYDMVFTTVRLDTQHLQFLVKPFLNEYSKQAFREKVFREVSGIHTHMIRISSLMSLIEKSAQIEDYSQLQKDLENYLKIGNYKREESENALELQQGIAFDEVISSEEIIIENNQLSWEEAINKAAKPLLDKKSIEKTYVDEMVRLIRDEQPYIMIADGIIIAHAGIDKGVNEVAVSLLILPEKINIQDYMDADIIFVLATPDTTSHLNVLYKIIEISESTAKLKEIRQVKDNTKVLEIINR